MEVSEAIDRVCESARNRLKPERVRLAKERQAAVFAWREPDYLPLTFHAPAPELDGLPCYDWRERWHEPDKSFLEQMKAVVGCAAAESDALPSLRADTGVVNGPSLFGAGFGVPPHTKPVVTQYVAKEKLAAFALPDDIRPLGIAPRIVEHMEHHLALLRKHGLADSVGMHHCDTQGPFDIAEQTRGHDFFTDLYEDPAFVEHLMTQATRAYVALNRLCKSLNGEPPSGGNASGFWMERGGVRLCDDSGILLSPRLYEEQILPHQAKALAEFQGGWIHYCGGVPGGGRREGLHLHDAYLKIPALRGLNFTTGHDQAAEVRKVIGKKVAYIGGFPRGKDEALEDYFRRVLSLCPGKRGILFGPELRPGEHPRALDAWHKCQEEMF